MNDTLPEPLVPADVDLRDLTPGVGARILTAWAGRASHLVGLVRLGGAVRNPASRFVQGRTSYVQAERLKDVRRVLSRATSPGRQDCPQLRPQSAEWRREAMKIWCP